MMLDLKNAFRVIRGIVSKRIFLMRFSHGDGKIIIHEILDYRKSNIVKKEILYMSLDDAKKFNKALKREIARLEAVTGSGKKNIDLI